MLQCGLLGRKLGHSWSPQLHRLLGDYAYRLYEREPEELEAFLRSEPFDGLNVTIPYKKAVLPFCDSLSPMAQTIGSVNTLVRRPDGTLFGDNTDAAGFRAALEASGMDVRGRKALVLGSGGASLAVQAVLKSLDAREVVVVSRSGSDNYGNLSRHADAELVVNATPVGMWPDVEASPVSLRTFPRCMGVADLIYNPMRTTLLLEAEELGISHFGGLTMLAAQAMGSSADFTGCPVSPDMLGKLVQSLQRAQNNLILIGMPGCGKSAVGQALGSLLGMRVLDCDAEISRRFANPADLIREQGEAAFRRLETDMLQQLCENRGVILTTGGGCVTRTENRAILRRSGTVIWLQRELRLLSTADRPLSQTQGVESLWEQRRDLYSAFSDMQMDNHKSITETAEAICRKLGYWEETDGISHH